MPSRRWLTDEVLIFDKDTVAEILPDWANFRPGLALKWPLFGPYLDRDWAGVGGAGKPRPGRSLSVRNAHVGQARITRA
jgi:hypothetical protein